MHPNDPNSMQTPELEPWSNDISPLLDGADIFTLEGHYRMHPSDPNSERLVSKWVEEAHVKCDPPVQSSSGPTDNYLDMYRVLLRDPVFWQQYFYAGLLSGALTVNGTPKHYWPIGCGRSGSLIIGLLGFGTVWNRDKQHGLEWSGQDIPEGTEVVIVDDCMFTGGTIRATAQAAAKRGLVVKHAVVAWPYKARITLEELK